MSDDQTIAVLGAGGTMGLPIARNLVCAGFPVRAWNRSREKAEPLETYGAQITGSPDDAAAGADVVLTMLTDADAVLESMRVALEAKPADGAIWLQMSTIGERGIERCQALAEAHGLAFVDAPVLGTKQPAEEANLVIMAAGSSELRPRLEPIFDTIGQRTIWLEEVGTATRLKVAVNSWILSVVEGVAETLALAEGMELDPRLVLEAVSGGTLDLPYLQMKGKAIIERNFEPSFKLALAAKDAALVEESAERHGLDLPLARTIRDRLSQGAAEHGDADMAATYLTSAPAS